jgi:polyhydroxyalkanoate synthase
VFSSLRANDMIWSYVVNNYLLGREPFPFDILYWNADSTRMPAKAHAFYLRQMYLNNALIVPNEIKLAGVPIDIRKIDVPCYFLSTREDHIAPWQSTYAALANLRTQFTFVLSGSGHVGGVVNPPARKKYGYLTNEKYYASAADWLACAEPCSGSWWEHWEGWLGLHSGAEIPVKRIEPTLGKAPGTYVFVR